MPKDKRPSTFIRIDPKLHRRLKVEAAKKGMSMSAYNAMALYAMWVTKPGA